MTISNSTLSEFLFYAIGLIDHKLWKASSSCVHTNILPAFTLDILPRPTAVCSCTKTFLFCAITFIVTSGSYDGLEASLSDLGSCVSERREMVAALRAANMELIVGLYSSWTDYECVHMAINNVYYFLF